MQFCFIMLVLRSTGPSFCTTIKGKMGPASWKAELSNQTIVGFNSLAHHSDDSHLLLKNKFSAINLISKKEGRQNGFSNCPKNQADFQQAGSGRAAETSRKSLRKIISFRSHFGFLNLVCFLLLFSLILLVMKFIGK